MVPKKDSICESIKHFRHMIEGRHFTIFTDHKPLTFASDWRPISAPRASSTTWTTSGSFRLIFANSRAGQHRCRHPFPHRGHHAANRLRRTGPLSAPRRGASPAAEPKHSLPPRKEGHARAGLSHLRYVCRPPATVRNRTLPPRGLRHAAQP